jgi:hypothetical protein
MNKTDIIRSYITYLQEGDMEKVIGLFSNENMVSSPVYGVMSAQAFYTKLASDTQESILEIHSILHDNHSDTYALYFNYKWRVSNGELIDFDVVDIIKFDKNSKIKSLKIIYDASMTKDRVGG